MQPLTNGGLFVGVVLRIVVFIASGKKIIFFKIKLSVLKTVVYLHPLRETVTYLAKFK